MTKHSPAARVDVLMTAYNAGDTICDAINSILGQDYSDFRLIVVDDGSTDKTGEIVESLALRDERILVIRQTNVGIVTAANRGLAVCNAEFVARLDADDIAFKNRLRLQVDVMDKNPDCVAVSGLVYHIDARGNRLGPVAGSFDLSQVDPYAIPSAEPYIMHPVVLFRRRAVEEVGRYRYVDFAEDTDLYWRLLHVGHLQVLNAIIGEYRVHGGSVTSLSIMNGRISAINSQLSAISEQRRREHRADLDFLESDLAKWRCAGELREILEAVRERLDANEFGRYRLAVAAKLLELNSYRPYSFDDSDCSTLHEILVENKELILSQNRKILRLWARACARLIRQGYRVQARTLYDPSIRLALIERLIIQFIEGFIPRQLIRMYRGVKSRARILHS